MRNNLIFMFGILFFLVQTGKAQQDTLKRFTLKEAVEFAKKNNFNLINSRLDMESSEKKVNEVLALGLPQVNANANLINNVTIGSNVINFGGQPMVIKFGTPYSSTIGLTATQLIFDGTFFLGLKASKEFVNLSKLNINRSEIETEVNVSKAYYSAILVDVKLKMLNKNIETLEKSKRDLELTFKNGLVEKIDVDRLTLQLSNLKLDRDKSIDLKLLTLMLLKFQMGINVNSNIELTDNLDDLFLKASIESAAEKIVYENRIEYKMLQEQLTLNILDKKRYYVGYLPSLAAFYNNQRNTFGDKFGDLYKSANTFPASSVGLSLNVPIFDGLRKTAQIQQTRINIRKNENDLKNIESLIEQQVYQSRTHFSRTKEQIEIQKRNLELAQEIYNRSEIKYKNGVGSSLELTTSQSDLENARTNYLTTVYDYFVAELELKKSLGNIK
ncbi:MAG: TolC family protein [Bacteroidota bacterium]|nr:TolC family protein [Bacteroidota bacterium]